MPYSSRRYFSDKLESCDLLKMRSLIFAGDLNLTINEDNEVWGGNCRLDPLAGYFIDFFGRNHLVDILLDPFILTLRNGWIGSTGITKRLDRFMLYQHLVECLGYC